VPHLTENGSVAGFFVLAEDVTDEVEAQEMLQRLREELAHALRTRTLGELTAAIAHELNQPLASIRTNAQAAQRMVHTGQVSCDDIDEILEDIVADNQRAAEVITRLRALLTQGKVQSKNLNINEVVEQVEKLVRQDAIMRDVVLRFDLEKDLPTVEGDPIQLQQVLLNLIINGFEAMDELPPGRERTLKVITERSGNSAVAVTVSDSGKGFGKLDLSSLFEPFKTTKKDGLGMGLAISRSIIESQHGRIEALSQNGGGAMVRFVLPKADLESGDGAAVNPLNAEEA
jgi:C4-dicarboxylate-specific signal transduction histidine kinase